ncbi:MAG: diaminopimelate decarboxylase [Betaproteobacteria bacterium]|nr:diaminopimelate decarboxylase [Betaproteobacteria bacterium]
MQDDFAHLPWLSRTERGLCVESIALTDIAAQHGTPAWVYSKQALSKHWQAFADALSGRKALICYAMKANPNLSILRFFAEAGAGFDIVSGGELARVLQAGGSASTIVFSGVGKRRDEIRDALTAGVKCFNVESAAELRRIGAIAADLGLRAPISLRVNPDVDAKSHPYISTGLKENKFGIAHQEALALYREAAKHPGLKVVGIDCHIGSQITDMPPFMAALEKLLELIEQLHSQGIALSHLDLGGGLGIRYTDEDPPSPAAFMQSIVDRIERHPQAREMELIFEFGRALVGNAGLLLTRLEYVKQNGDRLFAVVDAAMNDLIRPALYEGYHPIIEVHPTTGEPKLYDVVGPVCESGDWLGKARSLRLGVEDDLLAILSAGAYGMAMSSNYNARPRAIELLVDGTSLRVIRERETVASLWQSEV